MQKGVQAWTCAGVQTGVQARQGSNGAGSPAGSAKMRLAKQTGSGTAAAVPLHRHVPPLPA